MFDEWVFNLGIRFYKNATNLKAGEYAFAPGVSMQQIMNRSGGRQCGHPFGDHSGGLDHGPDHRARARASGTGRRDHRSAGRRRAACRRPIHSRGAWTRQGVLDQMKAAQDKLLAEIWERAHGRSAGQFSGGSGDPGLDRGKGNGACR